MTSIAELARYAGASVLGVQTMTDDDPVVVPISDELDLHSFQPRDIPSVVIEYLHEAVARGFTRVRIVHGRGRGVQRGIVQALLDQQEAVLEFWDDPTSHLGATIVTLSDRHTPS